ncbi:MAG: N-acetyltransferase [Ignavibacteriae bacterium]|nr:MAG: N-acetyltransferase [Ignavibacteriota bacterium]
MILETQRLFLRKFETTDITGLSRIYTDEDVMRYIGRGGVLNAVQALKMIEYWKKCYEDPGYGEWAVINKEDGKLIGHCGFQYLKSINETEIAYLLDKPYWGKGLASEISQAALSYGFKQFNFKKLVAIVYPDNKPSIRVIEKMGMKFIGNETFFEKSLFLYSLTRKQWEKKSQLRMKNEE